MALLVLLISARGLAQKANQTIPSSRPGSCRTTPSQNHLEDLCNANCAVYNCQQFADEPNAERDLINCEVSADLQGDPSPLTFFKGCFDNAQIAADQVYEAFRRIYEDNQKWKETLQANSSDLDQKFEIVKNLKGWQEMAPAKRDALLNKTDIFVLWEQRAQVEASKNLALSQRELQKALDSLDGPPASPEPSFLTAVKLIVGAAQQNSLKNRQRYKCYKPRARGRLKCAQVLQTLGFLAAAKRLLSSKEAIETGLEARLAQLPVLRELPSNHPLLRRLSAASPRTMRFLQTLSDSERAHLLETLEAGDKQMGAAKTKGFLDKWVKQIEACQ